MTVACGATRVIFSSAASRLKPAGSATLYEDRVADNHHHLVCRVCGRLVDVDCAVGDVPCLTAADDYGFQIDEAEVIYWGRCPECISSASVAADDPTATPERSAQSQGSLGVEDSQLDPITTERSRNVRRRQRK